MPDQHLPVFRIQDFDAHAHRDQYFYLSRFADHLREHQFIQRPHKHSFFIVLLITNGSGTHTIDFVTYTVAPGRGFFLSPGQVHHWQLSPDADGYIIFFSQEFYLLGHPHKKLYRFPFFRAFLHQPFVTVSEAAQGQLKDLIRSIAQEHAGQLAQKNDVIRDYLDVLLILLMRLYQAQNPTAGTAVAELAQLHALEHLIDQHYRARLPVAFYAGQLHQTPKQLNDSSKRTVGKTITELIQDRVLLEARRLLVHSRLSVTQVAAELGYFDNSYFSRFFKKHVGQTPEQFRASHGASG